jgi:DNA-binding NarL/FixJ family response regulator
LELAAIDDHPILLDAVAMAVELIPGDHAARGFSALDAYDEAIASGARFDLVLLDLGLPGYSGLQSLSYFREWHDDTPVVVLSATHDRETILKALDIGAMGFIPKTSPRDVLIGAIRLVASGGVYIPPEALSGRADAASGTVAVLPTGPVGKSERKALVPDSSQLPQALTALTPRQNDVLAQLVKGLPNKLICRQLGLSPNTVKTHVSAIFRALDVSNRTQAVICIRQLGLRVDLRRIDRQ